MSFSFRKVRRGVTATAALALALPAFAQDAAPADQPAAAPAAATQPQKEVEEIIVTATKREANIQDVPIAVSAFQGDELTARGVSEVEQFAQVSPSINVNSSNTASGGGTIRIRGVGTTGNNIGLEGAVGVFIDGVYRPRSGQAFADLLDIERVEVLRGPQGTLFGKNTSAGAINVISKKPLLSGSDGFALAEFGNYNEKRFAGSYSAPIIDEVLGFRLSGQWTGRDGYYEDFHSNDAAGKRDRYTLRGQLEWAPTDALDFRVIGDYGQRHESCCPAVWVRGGPTVGRVLSTALARGLGKDVPTVQGPDVSQIGTNKWHVGWNYKPFENIEDWGASLEANWDLDFVKLTSITAYRRFQASYGEDVDFTSSDVLHRQDANNPGGAFDHFANWSEELRAGGTLLDGMFDYLFGFYGYTEKVSTHTRIEWGADAGTVIGTAINAAALTPGEGYERDASIDTGGWALFTNNTFHPFKLLDLTVGARYGQETKDAHSVVNGAPFGTYSDPVGCANPFITAVGVYPVGQVIQSFCHNLSWANSGVTEKEWTYTFSGTFHVTEEINVYYSYSRGYKAGGFNTDQDAFDCALPVVGAGSVASLPLSGTCAASPGGVEANGTHFLPEFSKSHELGIKGTYLDGRARVNVTYFRTHFEDFQLNSFTGLGFIVSNADSAISQGAELEAFFKLSEALDATLGITYADARYGRHLSTPPFSLATPWPATDPHDGLPCLCRIDGHRLTNAPAWTGALSLNYEHQLPATEWIGFFDANTSYRGRHNTGSNLHPYKFEKAHWFLNLTVGAKSPDGHWEASLWSNNLTNTYDRQVIFDTPTQSGTFGAYVAPPRMFGGTLRYNFD